MEEKKQGSRMSSLKLLGKCQERILENHEVRHMSTARFIEAKEELASSYGENFIF